MIITLKCGSVFNINDSSDIIDNEIEGLTIISCNREDEFDVEFVNTDHLLAYLKYRENNPEKTSAIVSYLFNVQPSHRDEDYISKFEDCYIGEFENETLFAEERGKELYADELAGMDTIFKNAIDWHKIWESDMRYDHWFHGLHYFRNQ